MRVVILAGGTGSIALQRGLHRALDARFDGVDTKVVVNAYDNGLSTGAVRAVMDGRILGPSDVRKNQTTRLQLRDSESPWLPLLNCRFTSPPKQAPGHCARAVEVLMRSLKARGEDPSRCGVLLDSIDQYFAVPKAMKIDYEDFALANVIYAGLAKANGYSLRAAASVMAGVLGIPDSVLLNDDKSLFLGALTRSGRKVSDEGEIVAWGDESDPFVDLFFVDADGQGGAPRLCLEAWQAILAADLVILSTGTQWSSLIPTYASEGFREVIAQARARILMVMNRIPDRDSPSQTASDIVNVLVPRYFDPGRLHVLSDLDGHPRMRSLDESALEQVASFTQARLSDPAGPADKHDPDRLAAAVGRVFFRDHLDSDFFLFDYDDTLFGRANRLPRSSQFNVRGISQLNCIAEVGICTGNTIRALELRQEPQRFDDAHDKPLLVFADGGINRYSYAVKSVNGTRHALEVEQCVSPDALLPETGPFSADGLITGLTRAGVAATKIDNRGNAVIAIKPVEPAQREALMSLVRHLLRGSDLQVRACGTTTIEIRKPTLSKTSALRHLCEVSVGPPRITYVGDELDEGNDRDVRDFARAQGNVRCLHVASLAETAFFIATLIDHLQHHVSR